MNKLLKAMLNPIVARFTEHDHRLESLELGFDHLLHGKKYEPSKKGAFNGQEQRKLIFAELLKLFDFDVIIETGTRSGNTTAYMRETSGLPVITCELDKILHQVAQKRLEDFDNITFARGDSRKFLSKLFKENTSFSEAFIYLDAHWYDDLPLAEELRIISSNFEGRAVVMVDDFRVPGDEGYGYDDYDRKKTLDMKTFSKVFEANGFEAFFPAVASSEENGAVRGCVVLINRDDTSRLSESTRLRSMN